MTMGVVRPCSGISIALGMHSKATVGIGLHQHGRYRMSTGRTLVTHALGGGWLFNGIRRSTLVHLCVVLGLTLSVSVL